MYKVIQDQVSVNVYNLGTNSEKNISHLKNIVYKRGLMPTEKQRLRPYYNN